jgi:GTP1/Obg family GTP-binding protein
MAFKNHVVSCAAVVTQMKELMAMSKNALAALPAADVEAVVVAGYPPPA